MTGSRKKQRGLTLAETLMALVILGVFTTAIFSAVTNGYRLAERSKETSRALYLNNEIMEQFSTEVLGEGWGSYTPDPTLKKSATDSDFCYRLTVEDLSSNLRRAECRVFWQDPNSTSAAIDTSKPQDGLVIRSTTLVYRD